MNGGWKEGRAAEAVEAAEAAMEAADPPPG